MLQKSSRCHPTRVLTRLFNCTKCKKGFTTAKAALKHEKDHHGEDGKPFKCKLCQVKFSHSWAVTNHLRKGRCKGSQIISWEMLNLRLSNILRSHLLPKNKLHDLHVIMLQMKDFSLKRFYCFRKSSFYHIIIALRVFHQFWPKAIACIYFKPRINGFYQQSV